MATQAYHPSGEAPTGQATAVALDLAADRMDRALYRRRRRKLWLLLLPLLGLLLGAVQLLTQPRVYQAIGEIQLLPAPIRSTANFRRFAVDKRAYGDEVEALTSGHFYARVAEQLDPAHHPNLFAAKAARPGKTRKLPADPRAALMNMLANGLRATIVPKTGLVDLTFRHPDPVIAATVVNAAIDAAALVGYDTERERVARGSGFFASRMTELSDEIQRDEAKEDERNAGDGLLSLDLTAKDPAAGGLGRALSRRALKQLRRRGHGLKGADEKFDFRAEVDPNLLSLTRAAEQAQLNERLAEARLRLEQSFAAQGGELIEDDRAYSGSLQALSLNLAAEQARYASLNAELGPRQPENQALAARIVALRREIDNINQLYLVHLRGEVQGAAQARGKIEQALAAKQAEVRKELEAEISHAALELELALDLTIYQDLEERLLQSRYSATGGPIAVSVVNRAEVPTAPTRLSIIPVLAGYAGAALVLGWLGMVALFAGELKLWSVVELEERTGVSALAIVPEEASLRTSRNDEPAAIQTLSSALDQQLLGGLEWPRRVLFTSATPGEGKTTCCLSFAVALAQRGSRVLVLDCNLHRPAVHRRLHLDRRVGLSQVLTGRTTLADAVQAVPEVPGLFAVTAGALPPRASEVIGSLALSALLDAAEQDFDCILLDSPPLLVSTDALAIGPSVDAMVLVARFGAVTSQAISGAQRLCARAGAPLAGVMINGVPPKLLAQRG